MALRDQPYLPLYIQDFLTDEKLNECSAATTGVYVKLMCLMHKSDDYGKLLLKHKYKTSESKERNFASMLVRVLPFTFDEVYAAIIELISEKVLYMEDDFICQKRMIKDNNLSVVRSSAGQKGGKGGNAKNKPTGPGYIYLISNKKDHKIGLSISPERRVFQLRSKYNMPDLEVVNSFKVKDMLASEVYALKHFKDYVQDEWLFCDFEFACKEFEVIKKALVKANTGANTEYENEIKTVIDYLNNKASTDFKTSTKETRQLIITRINEGYNVEQFKTVVDKKTEQWKNTDQSIYLRPGTLFGNKFEGYLNQKNERATTAIAKATTTSSNRTELESLVERSAEFLQAIGGQNL